MAPCDHDRVLEIVDEPLGELRLRDRMFHYSAIPPVSSRTGHPRSVLVHRRDRIDEGGQSGQ
jgi:hypothetical protein